MRLIVNRWNNNNTKINGPPPPSASPEEVFRSGSHAHLLVDLLVDASSPVLQFTALSLCQRITPLQRHEETEKAKEVMNMNSKDISFLDILSLFCSFTLLSVETRRQRQTCGEMQTVGISGLTVACWKNVHRLPNLLSPRLRELLGPG